MGQDALISPNSEYIHRHEQSLREQLNEACRLARELDERVRSIPTGTLCVGSNQSEGATTTQLRCNIAIATADVVAAFNKAIQLLLQNSYCTWEHPLALSAASSPQQTPLHSPRQQKATNYCVPSVKAINLAAGQSKSPPLSPAGKHLTAPYAPRRAAHCKQQSNILAASASASPSPPAMTHSPLFSATSEMSDASPKSDLPADEATTTNPIKAVICRKRKPQPKVALKMPAGNAEIAESNTPPDDGHTWRKYGQKNILGSQYPRSYYRCTHKADSGCPALKQVQRCDEDDAFYDVVYKGYHQCRSAELDKECWPLAFPQGLSSFIHFPDRSTSLIPSAAASLMLANMSAAKQSNAAGGLQLTHHASQLDNLMAHQLCHVVSVASSDALPLNCNADPYSAKLSSGAERSSASVINPALQSYQFNNGQALLAMMNSSTTSTGGSDHLHPHALFTNSAAAIEDGSSSKDQLNSIGARGSAATAGGGHVHGIKGTLQSIQYNAQEQERAVNPLEVWPEFENINNEEVCKRLASYSTEVTTNCNNINTQRRLSQPYGSLLFQAKPQVTLAGGHEAILSPPLDKNQHDSALAFDAMDNDDDLLGYLDP